MAKRARTDALLDRLAVAVVALRTAAERVAELRKQVADADMLMGQAQVEAGRARDALVKHVGSADYKAGGSGE